ncbi:hypothetical protein F4820DRAFT_428602 [Hypoxylon rubiginosum]|uniref:Uncharacterized protein n=1 Tax=Hypoxylon rubiginosum TaxID=110542 RepID=A0ACB9YUW6_9PEZI|nr:hypothetical protein F4820DRAFT_428602 [Hypoxylon rubiginosum]
MALVQVVSKTMELVRHLVVKCELNTVNWVEELRLIGCACVLAAIIVKSIRALSEKLSQYPSWTSAVDTLSSYFYQPPPHLRTGPIGENRRRPSQSTYESKPPNALQSDRPLPPVHQLAYRDVKV